MRSADARPRFYLDCGSEDPIHFPSRVAMESETKSSTDALMSLKTQNATSALAVEPWFHHPDVPPELEHRTQGSMVLAISKSVRAGLFVERMSPSLQMAGCIVVARSRASMERHDT
jgi:hypothetical protein